MRYLFIISFILFFFNTAFCTHNRAGEITYKQISDLTFEITVTTFTYTLSPADRPELEVSWGDNTTSIVPRVEKILLPNNYQKNIYKGQHTYPGPGTFAIVVEDPNRNYGVNNIPNSVNVVFSIKTILQINQDIGYNNTPILLNPPVDKAAKGRLFIHNPAAYDPDGDSISYKLGICTGENGLEIPGYTFPKASTAFYIDSITGDLIWDAPLFTGIYNVAIIIEEWRNGKKIGKITRDMQIEVLESENNPPVIDLKREFCIGVDTSLIFMVKASDPDNDYITLTGSGGPLYLNDSSATFYQPTVGQGQVSSQFKWDTRCSHVRRQRYQVTFKAIDNYASLNLVDIKNALIKVIGPAPKNINLEPTNNSIKITWNPNICPEAAGYYIYRREGFYGFIPDSCQTGVPSYTNYTRIATINGLNSTTYIDNNNGIGLKQGYEYCYIITSFWDDGAEGYASEEICSPLVRGIPVITNVSIEETNSSNGKIYLAWSKPNEFDSILAPGPYKYLIYRSNDLWGANLSLIDSLNNINDTIYYNQGIDTKTSPWSYKVEFYNDSPNNRFLIGSPQIASSVFLNIKANDNKLNLEFEKNVPWINSKYIIYRQNPSSLLFDSIGFTDSLKYTDINLENGKEYCYKVKSIGGYNVSGFVNPIINFSQQECEIPIDTFPPCQPLLNVTSNCDSLSHSLIWNNPNNSCADDVIGYNIYYSTSLDGQLKKIQSIDNSNDTTYYYKPTESMAACYVITAIDSFYNESSSTMKVCVDNCSYYELPNVFSPDGDGKNDLFKPGPYYFVEKIDIKIYNRWGVLVFQTDNPDINWDGTNFENNKPVSDGVYYYVCDVYERRISGIEARTLLGFIHVFNKKNIKSE